MTVVERTDVATTFVVTIHVDKCVRDPKFHNADEIRVTGTEEIETILVRLWVHLNDTVTGTRAEMMRRGHLTDTPDESVSIVCCESQRILDEISFD